MEISTSRQVCMDYSSDHWLQGTINEEEDGLIMDSSSPPSGDHNILMTCSSGPLIERKLRPPHHDQSLKCPRCDSTHTKFCYYNNYSLTQPRYFCKSCRRYWTKGGTLRNIPVGGGCRKNKKLVASSSKKSSTTTTNILQNQEPTHDHDLQLSYPEMSSFSHFNNNFVGSNNACGFMFENHIPIDFMESKYEALMGTSTTSMNHQDFLENGQSITTNSYGFATNFSTMDVNNNYDGTVVMDGYEEQNHRLNLSLDHQCHDQQGFSESGKESFGYIGTGGLGSWTGFMSTGYGSSAPNPLV